MIGNKSHYNLVLYCPFEFFLRCQFALSVEVKCYHNGWWTMLAKVYLSEIQIGKKVLPLFPWFDWWWAQVQSWMHNRRFVYGQDFQKFLYLIFVGTGQFTVFPGAENVASEWNFYRQQVQLSYWCHLKGSCMCKFLKKSISPPFEF